MERKKKNSKLTKNEEGIIIALVVLVILFFLMYFFFHNYGKINYQGLIFTKEKFGKIPIYRYSYYFNDSGQTYKYNLYLRNDPRKNNIPVDEGIEFSRGKMTFISINSTLSKCEDGGIAISSLSAFLTNNLINVKGATPDKKESEENNIRYATCESYPDNTVILIQPGEETRIDKKNKNCYIVSISQCQILDAVEKFEVQSILDAKARNN